jgi:hypothetical protein
MNQPIMLLAYVLLWTSFLIIASIIFFHAVFAALTVFEIAVDLFMSLLESIFPKKGN